MCDGHLLHLSFAFWQLGCHYNYNNNHHDYNNSRRWNNDNNSGRNNDNNSGWNNNNNGSGDNDNNGGSTDPGGWDLLLPGSHQCGKYWEQAGC